MPTTLINLSKEMSCCDRKPCSTNARYKSTREVLPLLFLCYQHSASLFGFRWIVEDGGIVACFPKGTWNLRLQRALCYQLHHRALLPGQGLNLQPHRSERCDLPIRPPGNERNGCPSRTRTYNLAVNSRLLCH